MAPRGRPPRAGVSSQHQLRVRMTSEELARVEALAAANDCSVSDIVRLGVLTLAADLDDGDSPAPVILGGSLTTALPVVGARRPHGLRLVDGYVGTK